jgi:hypothetical protein
MFICVDRKWLHIQLTLNQYSGHKIHNTMED